MASSSTINCLPDDVLVKIFRHSNRPVVPPAGCYALRAISQWPLTDPAAVAASIVPEAEFWRGSSPDLPIPAPPASADAALVLAIAAVCRRWRRIAHRSARSLHVRQDRMVAREDLARIVAHFTALTHVHLSDGSVDGVDDDLLAALASSCPDLTMLLVGAGINTPDPEEDDSEDEEGKERPVTTAGLDALFRACPGLEHLSLHCAFRGSKLPPSFFRLTRLRTLCLRDLTAIEDPGFTDLALLAHLSVEARTVTLSQLSRLSALPNLTSLFVPKWSWLVRCNAALTFPDLPALRSLGFAEPVEDAELAIRAEWTCARLQRLLLNVTNASLPDLSSALFPCLRELWLSEIRLDALSFTTLGALEALNIFACPGLLTLPEDIGRLTRLKSLELHVVKCARLAHLPRTISGLTALKMLTVEEGGLASLEEGLSELTGLRSLVPRKCHALQHLPPLLSMLSSLTDLEISSRRVVSLPEGIGQLSKLCRLWLGGCARLEKAPESLPASLQALGLGSDSSSVELPDMAMAPNLRRLCLNRVAVRQRLATSRTLSELEQLEVRLGPAREVLPVNLRFLSHLRALHVSRACSLQELPNGIGSAVPQLRQLHVGGAECLEEIPDSVTHLTHLSSLRLEAPKLTCLPNGLGVLTRLRDLSLHGCSSLSHLPPSITNLSYLGKLDVSGSPLVALFPSFRHCTRLRELHLVGCVNMRGLPEDVWRLTALRLLDLRGWNVFYEVFLHMRDALRGKLAGCSLRHEHGPAMGAEDQGVASYREERCSRL
ncbi:hypothetical protein CLOP_g3885 [Closterium sp. NIES-67]|nr:hypothetical protein CLOP_g3885 [Closterium sp. NIES-67]